MRSASTDGARRRPFTSLVAFVGVGVSAGALVLRWARSTPAALVAAVHGAPLLAALCGLVGAAAARRPGRRWLRRVGVAAAFGWLAHVVAAQRRHRRALGSGPVDLSVGAANMLFLNREPDAAVRSVLAAVGQHDLDVLVTAETTDAMVGLLADGLGPAWAPAGSVVRSGLCTVLWTRLPVTQRTELSAGARSFPVVAVSTPSGAVVRVVGVHVSAPHTRRDIGYWTEELHALGALVAVGGGGVDLTVLAGDFNSDVGHPPMRRLVRSVFDAGRAWGAVGAATWPTDRFFPPVLTLDHVLVDRPGVVVDAGRFPIAGSDHAGVWANLAVLPRGGGP